MSLNVKLTFNSKEFYATANQAKTIQTLLDTQKGGFARVNGYVSENGEVANLTVLTRFSTEKLYSRKIAALQQLSFNDVLRELLESDNGESNLTKLKDLSLNELQQAFTDRRNTLIESMQKTQSGDRSDAYRQAADENYCVVGTGVKIHYVADTVVNADGKKIKRPVLTDGIPTADSIMLGVVAIKKDIVTFGVYKKVNSGVPVLIGNVLESLMPRSTRYRSLSLKEGKFDTLSISNELIEGVDVD